MVLNCILRNTFISIYIRRYNILLNNTKIHNSHTEIENLPIVVGYLFVSLFGVVTDILVP